MHAAFYFARFYIYSSDNSQWISFLVDASRFFAASMPAIAPFIALMAL